MGHQEELEEIDRRLQEDGLLVGAPAEERLCHLWQLLQRKEGDLVSATQDLHILRTQQATEMKEVENYVEHIRNLLEERESLTAEYEHENEQLRAELQQLRLQQDAQLKEVVEMLDQEGLAEISHSSPSEQVAYLLVERATLLERLEAVERKLDAESLTGSLRDVHLQGELDLTRHVMEEELRQQRESMQHAKESMSKAQQSPCKSPWKKLFGVRKAGQSTQTGASKCIEDAAMECVERQRLERDLDEASRRLSMAHEEIRRLTDELDSARKPIRINESGVQNAGPEVEHIRPGMGKELDVGLQMAMANERLDQEIRALRGRVRSLDSERKSLLEMIENMKVYPAKAAKVHLEELPSDRGQGEGDDSPQDLTTQPPAAGNQEQIHNRCHRELEDKDSRLRELQRRLQKQQREQEELVERNEELESLLGEAQNQSKVEQERHECEMEGLQRKIKSLEAELSKTISKEAQLQSRDPDKESNDDKEWVAVLEGRLMEEKEWRKQLELDLTATQAAFKKDKEEWQMGQKELKKLRMEIQSLQAKCQLVTSLNTNLSHVSGEKDTLMEKVSELECAQNQLRSDLDHQTLSCSRAQEDLTESKGQVAELSAQVGQLKLEVSKLERESDHLRERVVEEQERVKELQSQLSKGFPAMQLEVGEKACGAREPFCLREKLHSTWEERQGLNQEANPRNEDIKQLTSLKVEMGRLQSTLEEERQLASQHQMALHAQIHEAQARAKSQDSLLQQKGDECKLLRQDIQRTQSLFTSAERELRYEREKNLDLKRHNALLDQEKMKLCVELKQAQNKVSQLEESGMSQRAELESAQQKAKELELELARSGQNRQASSILQEELNAERARVIAADKKVLELQQQVKSTLHQLRLEEARAGETSQLERETRNMSDSLSELNAKLQQDQLQRKHLEQREDELQQQLRSLRVKEASVNRVNSELCHRLQQLEMRLGVLEREHLTTTEELQLSHKSCHKLQDQVVCSQQESERLQEELQQVVQQLDTHIRKYNEKQSQHKTKLRKAKQIYMKETAQRDGRIQDLENDLALASSLSQKERDWLKKMMEENEKLIFEKRNLLKRLNEAEEMENSSMRTASTIQQRVNLLEEENKQLHDRTLQLSNQANTLERALRNAQSVYHMQNIFPPESLLQNDRLLQTSYPSLMPGVCDTLGILEAIRRVKVSDQTENIKSSQSLPPSQPSEIGYLNVTSPVAPTGTQDPEESLSLGRDEV